MTPGEIKVVKFIDAHPNPNEGGPPRTTFEIGKWGVESITISASGNFVVVEDGKGNRLEVPCSRVSRIIRFTDATQVDAAQEA